MRFPGGSVAIPYDWRRAIGPHRGCQIDGNHPGKTGIHHAQTRGCTSGPTSTWWPCASSTRGP